MRLSGFRRSLLRKCATALAIALLVAVAGCRKPTPANPGADSNSKPTPTPTQGREDPMASLRLNPPKVLDIEVTPLESATAQGNATLTLTVADDRRLGKTLPIQVADRPVTLARVAGTPMKFSGTIEFDFDTFAAEMAPIASAMRQARAQETKRGRHDVGMEPRTAEMARQIDPAVLARLAAARRPFKIPPHFIDIGWLFVDAPRELMVTDLSVVEDPNRTWDPCSNAGTRGSAWTFGKLMSDMANQPVTGVDPADFVADWMRSWLAAQTINSFNVGARPNVQTILNNWPTRPDGKIDINQAPFRLLAIVNRLDLRKGGGYTKGDAGEGRFVFGLVNQSEGGGCSAQTRPMTVILEYGVPISGCTPVHNYAAKWIALGDIALGTAAYNDALQAVTDIFTAAGAGAGKPNGSAINQIRTNERTIGVPWELREFHVDAVDHKLHTVMPAMVSDSGFNKLAVIDQFIADNEAAILNKTYEVPMNFGSPPAPFRAGSSINTNDALEAWRGQVNDPAKTEARHIFSLTTCNACHGGEALDTAGDPFLHVRNRGAGNVASLSRFLLGNGTLASPGYFDFPDPFISGLTRPMGDLQDRRKDLAGLSGSCKGLGLFKDLAFKPLGMPH